MPVQWQERMFRFGLFNYHFLSRNLAAALILLPRIMTHYPYVKVSQHGMSLLVTSPNLAYTVMPQERSPLTKALWFTILTTALPSLLYQSSGYVQFGYRYSLDYMVYFVVLLAIGNRPLTKLFRALVVVAFAINLFLAIAFDRYMRVLLRRLASSRTGTTSERARARRSSAACASGDRRGSRRRGSRHRSACGGTAPPPCQPPPLGAPPCQPPPLGAPPCQPPPGAGRARAAADAAARASRRRGAPAAGSRRWARRTQEPPPPGAPRQPPPAGTAPER